MPRERGLNYTPDADGYSFEDTGIGEAAQASFHRLASGYPQQEPDQQEPDDIHHLADVITGSWTGPVHSGNTTRTAIWNSARTSGTSGQTCSATRKRCCPNGITTTSTS